MFSKGDRVLVDHQDAGETIEAMFLEAGAPDDAIEQDGRRVDVGWVQYDSGELRTASQTERARSHDVPPEVPYWRGIGGSPTRR